MKVKNNRILPMRDSLLSVKNYSQEKNILLKPLFHKWLYKNLEVLNKEANMLSDMIKPTKNYEEIYLPEYKKLLDEYALKDSSGNLVTYKFGNNDLYKIDPEKEKEFNEAVENLNKKYPELSEERQKQIDDYIKFLDEETELNLLTIKTEFIPDLPAGMLEFLIDIIE